MKKSYKYREHLGMAINAMMQSAEKDEYADLNPPSAFKKDLPKRKPIITNLKDWREMRQQYKDKMKDAVDAMMASALHDEYVDKNMPM